MLLPAGVRGEPNTTISLGIQNVLDEDSPFAAGSFENGYDESLATKLALSESNGRASRRDII